MSDGISTGGGEGEREFFKKTIPPRWWRVGVGSAARFCGIGAKRKAGASACGGLPTRDRKVSQCSKNARGAQAFAAFTSMVRTLAKTGTDSIVEGLLHVFHSAQMPDASAEVCH